MITSEQIIELRKAHGWAQHQLAEELGVTQASVSRYESGIKTPLRPVRKLLRRMYDEKFPNAGAAE